MGEKFQFVHCIAKGMLIQPLTRHTCTNFSMRVMMATGVENENENEKGKGK